MNGKPIEFLVADGELQAALRGAIGPKRRFFVGRGARGARHAPEGSMRIVVTWARHLSLCRLPGRADQRAGASYLVFVEPGMPVEALSEVGRLAAQDLSRLLFVSVVDAMDVHSYLRAFVTRLSKADVAERILHAWWVRGELQILTTSFRRITGSRRSIPPLRGLPGAACEGLEVVLDGTAIVWPRMELELHFDDLAPAVPA